MFRMIELQFYSACRLAGFSLPVRSRRAERHCPSRAIVEKYTSLAAASKAGHRAVILTLDPMGEAHFSRIIANSSQPKRCRLHESTAHRSRTLTQPQHRQLFTPVAQADGGLFFGFSIQQKKLSVREFLGSASSLPHCIAIDSRRLTLLPATEGQGEGASPCFLLTVSRPMSDSTIPTRCFLRSVA
jgi:hypothetical protein